MRIALMHDELVRMGGAEQVLLSLTKAFPEAPIYTLSYNSDNVYKEFEGKNIISSWFGRFIKDDKNLKRFFFPFAVWAMKDLDITGYDVILQSTTHCSKYIKKQKNTIVITYCHTPFRLVWRPNSYDSVKKSSGIKRWLYNAVIKSLKKIDKKAAENTDWFITNSVEVVPRIIEAYKPLKPVEVINPAVNIDNFYITEGAKDNYLVVSRFEPYKKVDLVIEAFNKTPERKLVVVGKGSMEKELKLIARQNIIFKNGLNSEQLAAEYSKCKALIFPQHEDYGITPLEANASGRPVIAYSAGGILDTMIPYSGNSAKATAVFFNNQDCKSLLDAVNLFETLEFDEDFIRAHARKFDTDHFVEKIKAFVYDKYHQSSKSLNEIV